MGLADKVKGFNPSEKKQTDVHVSKSVVNSSSMARDAMAMKPIIKAALNIPAKPSGPSLASAAKAALAPSAAPAPKAAPKPAAPQAQSNASASKGKA